MIRFRKHALMTAAGDEGTPSGSAAPAPAPAALPAAPAAPAAPAPAPAATDTPVFEDTGIPHLDMGLKFVGRNGYTMESPEVQAAIKGDFAPLKAALAEKGVAGAAEHVALLEQAWADHVRTEGERQANLAARVHSIAGGEEQWNAIKEWAAANAEGDEQAQVNAAFNQGGMVADAMAFFLKSQYEAANGTSRAPKSPASTSAPSAAPAAPSAMTRVEYTREVDKLHRRMGDAMYASPEYRELGRRIGFRG